MLNQHILAIILNLTFCYEASNSIHFGVFLEGYLSLFFSMSCQSLHYIYAKYIRKLIPISGKYIFMLKISGNWSRLNPISENYIFADIFKDFVLICPNSELYLCWEFQGFVPSFRELYLCWQIQGIRPLDMHKLYSSKVENLYQTLLIYNVDT